MISVQPDVLRRLRIPGYLTLALLVGMPLLELAASAWPPNIHLPGWRFTVIAGGATATVNSLLGLFLVATIALASGDRAVVLFVAFVSAIAAALCLIAGGMLPLDALQLRNQVKPETLSKYNLAWSLAFLKIMGTSVAFLALSINSFKAEKAIRSSLASRGSKKGMPLVVQGTAGRAGSPTENVAN
jgi:hypothetical protein